MLLPSMGKAALPMIATISSATMGIICPGSVRLMRICSTLYLFVQNGTGPLQPDSDPAENHAQDRLEGVANGDAHRLIREVRVDLCDLRGRRVGNRGGNSNRCLS